MGPQLTPLQEPWLIFLAVRTQPQTGAYWELILNEGFLWLPSMRLAYLCIGNG